MATTAHAVTATDARTTEAMTAGCDRSVAGLAFSSTCSDLDVRAQLDHAVGRDVEEVRGPRGVARHPREEVVAPHRHAGHFRCRDHGLARQEEGRVHDV